MKRATTDTPRPLHPPRLGLAPSTANQGLLVAVPAQAPVTGPDLALPRRDDTPIGLVLVLMGMPTDAQAQLAHQLTESLAALGVDVATVKLQQGHGPLQPVSQALEPRINPFTNMLVLHADSSVTSDDQQACEQLVQLLRDSVQGHHAQAMDEIGALTLPRHVVASDTEACHALADCMTQCMHNQAQLGAAFESQYLQRVAFWASDQREGALALNRITVCVTQRLPELNLCFFHLTSAPPLPAHITDLNLNENALTVLPNTWPPNLRTLHAEGNHLTALPVGLPASITTLSLKHNAIVALPQTLDMLPATCTVNLVHNPVSVADAHHLHQAALQPGYMGPRLVMSERVMALLFKRDLDEWAATQTNGGLAKARIERYVDGGMAAGTSLDLSHLALTSCPPLPYSVTSLDLGHNQLTRMPDKLPPHLTDLSVRENRLTALPATLPQTLESLHIRDNPIAVLPAVLPPALSTIDARNCRFAALPDDLPDTLKYLDFDNNLLTRLPQRLLVSLEELSVPGNLLNALPEALPGTLRNLNLIENLFTSIPACVTALPAACNVSMADNRLPGNVVSSCQALMRQPGYQGPQVSLVIALDGSESDSVSGSDD